MATEDPIPVSTIRKITVLGGAVGALAGSVAGAILGMAAGALSAIAPSSWSQHGAGVVSVGSKARSGIVPGAIVGAVIGALCEAFIFLFATWLHQVKRAAAGVKAGSVAIDSVNPAGPGELSAPRPDNLIS